MMEQQTERIESLKAGLAGAVAAASSFEIVTGGLAWVNGVSPNWAAALSLGETSLGETAVQGAIALLSGFLFGVTYRYVIRSDRNSHLQSGAVLAFGLVRGLAPIRDLQFNWPIVLHVLESLLLFGAAALLLDELMARDWIKRF